VVRPTPCSYSRVCSTEWAGYTHVRLPRAPRKALEYKGASFQRGNAIDRSSRLARDLKQACKYAVAARGNFGGPRKMLGIFFTIGTGLIPSAD
jgi:hypothetical protein